MSVFRSLLTARGLNVEDPGYISKIVADHNMYTVYPNFVKYPFSLSMKDTDILDVSIECDGMDNMDGKNFSFAINSNQGNLTLQYTGGVLSLWFITSSVYFFKRNYPTFVPSCTIRFKVLYASEYMSIIGMWMNDISVELVDRKEKMSSYAPNGCTINNSLMTHVRIVHKTKKQ